MEAKPSTVNSSNSVESAAQVSPVKKKKSVSFRAYEELHESHPTSYLETLMHLFKGNVGTGCYALAHAMKNSGIILGPILTVIIAVICTHVQHMLMRSAEFVKMKNQLPSRPDYAETIELSFLNCKQERWRKMASTMKLMCNIFICITQLGFCSVYLVFVGSNLHSVLNEHGINLGINAVMAIGLIPVMLSALVRKLKFIAIFSAIANICMLVGIILTIGYSSIDLPNFSDRPYITSPEDLPLFFGTVLFAFEGIALVLPLQNAMRKPENFSKLFGVLNVGMVIVSAIYVVIGVVGFWKYGAWTAGSLTLNLPIEKIFSQAIMLMISLGVMLGYALQFFVAIQIMFGGLSDSWKFAVKHPIFAESIFRVLIVLLTFAVAIGVPNLGLLISFIGCVGCVALSFIFPVLSETIILISEDSEKIELWVWIKNATIVLIGFAGFALGSALSLKAIIEN